MLFRALISLAIFGISGAGYAFTCDAYAGLNRYHLNVELDTENLKLTVAGDNGDYAAGSTTVTHLVRNNVDYYYLPASFSVGYELQVPRDGRSAALCLSANECYACR
jgi:hypothetical protein